MEFMFDFNFRSDLTLIKIKFKIFSFNLENLKSFLKDAYCKTKLCFIEKLLN